MELEKTEGGFLKENREIKKHPPGLYLLFLTEMWERFSYYGMRALLVMYLTTELVRGGLNFDKVTAMSLYGTFTSLVYFTPMVGGFITDRYLGQRKAITIGGITMAIGQFILFAQPNRTGLYLGLLFLIIGNGFFKPNISVLVGDLYSPGDKRKDSAFTIFYMGINVGSFLAPLVCGTLAEKTFATVQGGQVVHYGFRYGFLAAGIGMIISQILFSLLSNKYLGDIGKVPSGKPNKSKAQKKSEPLTKQEKLNTAVILILTSFVVFFWAGFEQAGSSLTIYTQDFINRDVMGKEIAVSWFQSLNPIFVVMFAPVLSALWIRLSKRDKGDLSIPAKMATGMILLGIGFILMLGACVQRGDAGNDVAVKANIMWLVGAYFFHTMGELCLSPVGLSMVSKLAPPKFASLLMGVWLLSTAIANKLAGTLAGYVETLGHMQIFGGIAVVSIVLGLILMVLSKKIVSMMESN